MVTGFARMLPVHAGVLRSSRKRNVFWFSLTRPRDSSWGGLLHQQHARILPAGKGLRRRLTSRGTVTTAGLKSRVITSFVQLCPRAKQRLPALGGRVLASQRQLCPLAPSRGPPPRGGVTSLNSSLPPARFHALPDLVPAHGLTPLDCERLFGQRFLQGLRRMEPEDKGCVTA